MKTHIASLRREAGVTQQQLADQVGVTRQTIISLEGERYVASLPLAYRIAKFFRKTIEDVFVLEEE